MSWVGILTAVGVQQVTNLFFLFLLQGHRPTNAAHHALSLCSSERDRIAGDLQQSLLSNAVLPAPPNGPNNLATPTHTSSTTSPLIRSPIPPPVAPTPARLPYHDRRGVRIRAKFLDRNRWQQNPSRIFHNFFRGWPVDVPAGSNANPKRKNATLGGDHSRRRSRMFHDPFDQ